MVSNSSIEVELVVGIQDMVFEKEPNECYFQSLILHVCILEV